MLDIDLYEFKGKIKEFQGEKIEFCQDKGVAVIEVGKARVKIDKRLRQMGCKDGERAIYRKLKRDISLPHYTRSF